MNITKQWEERFWDKVKKTDGCWLWLASTAGKGYGQFPIPGEQRCVYAHRLSYWLHKGPIPKGKQVCHTCDNPRCVNPEHLWVGSCAENLQDMKDKDRHLCGSKNSRAKLTEDQVRQIRVCLSSGMTQVRIALAFGISQIEVSRIHRKLRWAHVE